MDTTTIERRQLHGMWASVAPAWGEHAEYADTRGAAVTARLLERAAPRPGERVLELACGPGVWTGHLLRHASEVTAVDTSPEMLLILLVRRWLTAWTSGPGVLRRRRLPDPGRTPGRPVVLHHPPAAP